MKMWKEFALVVLAAVLVAIAYGTILIRRGFSALAQPSTIEKLVAREVRNAAIPARARAQENPWKDRFTPDIMAYARHHFADHCAACHANDGSVQTDMGQGLYPKPPDMRLPATQNLTDGELYYIIENGVRLTGMPAWGDPYASEQDDDSWQLVLFVRHLPQLTPDELNEMKHYNPTGPFDDEEEQREQQRLGATPSRQVGGHHHH
jgi:hypothetical protein